METFYFVREPDHMIECSETIPPCSDLDVIKQKHKIFKTWEEAKAYQRVLGVKDLKTIQQLNKRFKEQGLAVEYGYYKKEDRDMNMRNKKVVLSSRNNRYFELYDLYSMKYDRGMYSSIGKAKEAFFEQLRIENIPQSETIEEVCEMVYFDYEKFICVLLHDNGTYTKHSLSEVRLLKED